MNVNWPYGACPKLMCNKSENIEDTYMYATHILRLGSNIFKHLSLPLITSP